MESFKETQVITPLGEGNPENALMKLDIKKAQTVKEAQEFSDSWIKMTETVFRHPVAFEMFCKANIPLNKQKVI